MIEIGGAAPCVDVDRAELLPASSAAQLLARWHRGALLVSGSAVKVEPLQLDVDRFFRLCAAAQPRTLFARFFAEGAEPRTELVRRGAERDPRHAGGTLCLVDAHVVHAPLGRCVQLATRALGFVGKVEVACELTPAGGGFGLQLDDRPLLLVQLDGSARWAYTAAPVVDAPTRRLVFGTAAEDAFRRAHPELARSMQGELVETLLRPGDVLFLPPGTPHRTACGALSLSLSIAFAAPRFAETLVALMARQLEAEVEWRRRFPPLPDIGAPAQAGVVSSTANARLAQLRAWAQTLDAAQIVAAWNEMDSETNRWP